MLCLWGASLAVLLVLPRALTASKNSPRITWKLGEKEQNCTSVCAETEGFPFCSLANLKATADETGEKLLEVAAELNVSCVPERQESYLLENGLNRESTHAETAPYKDWACRFPAHDRETSCDTMAGHAARFCPCSDSEDTTTSGPDASGALTASGSHFVAKRFSLLWMTVLALQMR